MALLCSKRRLLSFVLLSAVSTLFIHTGMTCRAKGQKGDAAEPESIEVSQTSPAARLISPDIHQLMTCFCVKLAILQIAHETFLHRCHEKCLSLCSCRDRLRSQMVPPGACILNLGHFSATQYGGQEQMMLAGSKAIATSEGQSMGSWPCLSGRFLLSTTAINAVRHLSW